MNNSFYLFLLLVLLLFSCNKKEETLFELLDPAQTGITFANQLQETEQKNILNYEYFYNGGGVAAGDFNNDGLTDLFFTGNQVENKLYLNKGQLLFDDISEKAGITGRKGGWKTGVSLVDINADGWLDIYICYSGPHPPQERKNQLFINNGLLSGQENAVINFREEAESYGLADAGYSTQAAFLDYDGDGDLDMYLMNHNLRGYQRQEAHVMRAARDAFAGDKLFRNDNGKFTDVSQQAGIKSNPLGFGLGLVIADINQDNKPDIYVGNDYVEDDYLYLNNGDSTFTDALRGKITHTSRFTMGADIADINNDALPDVFTLDMLPEDNLRQKLLTFPDNWNSYQSTLQNGFWHQNMRNMLQINNGNGTFSEIGQLAGVSNTDWSWSALLADFDNDGLKDLFVSNGEVKDLTNADFIKYAADEEMKKASGQPTEALLNQIKKMPSSETKHYIFKNLDGLRFQNKQKAWGFDSPVIANGAVYADLDNDGDLEIITNVNNDVARIYRNNSQELSKQSAEKNTDEPAAGKATKYLKIKLNGPAQNPLGVGAKVWVYQGNNVQYQEFSPVRGFQSSIVDALHIGLGSTNQPVQVKVMWQDGRQQILNDVKVNQILEINNKDAIKQAVASQKTSPLFEKTESSLNFRHRENQANDYNRQFLLPYMYSYTGARMAKGDVNGDTIEDLYMGGARHQAGTILIGQAGNKFTPAAQATFAADSVHEDKDAVFFDADNDGDLDLYVVSGDYGYSKNHPVLQDRLYLNNGKGNFKRDTTALPQEYLNGSCVKVLDADNDGDKDLFVGSSVLSGNFPVAEPSFLLINNGKGKFEPTAAFPLGLVSDAAIADFDNNGFPDIMAVGEWMRPVILYNQNGNLTLNSQPETLSTLHGWWNRIASADLDGDGDLDFVLGNMGLNTQLKASAKEPITLTYADFDQNGTVDPFLSYFIGGVSYPATGRDEALEQVVPLRKKFTDYASYSKATLQDLFTEEQLEKASRLHINFTETIVLENTGGSFTIHGLPLQAQYSPVHAIAIDDFNRDGVKDILLCGNNSTYRLRIGKMDANQGVLLTGTGKFQYRYVPQAVSGLQLRGDIKDIQQVNEDTWVFFTNNGPAQVYQPSKRSEVAKEGVQASNPRNLSVTLKNHSTN